MSDRLIAEVVVSVVLAIIFIYVGLSTETPISSAFLFAGVIVLMLILAILFGIIAVLQRS